MVKRFALGWVLSSVPQDDDPQAWIMVRNSQRGWELPGGWVEDGERPEEAALRESCSRRLVSSAGRRTSIVTSSKMATLSG